MQLVPRPKLLVCDDDLGPRLSIRLMLEGKCELVLTDNVRAGLAAAGARDFDCAVIDWTMPLPNHVGDGQRGEGGGALLTELRQIDPDLAVVIWTAHDDLDEIARQRGAFATLPKPVDLGVLEETVSAASALTRAKRGGVPLSIE